MTTTIAQRELRNDSGEIMRRIEAGEEFVVTRNGTPVAELRPAARRRGITRERLVRAFRRLSAVDLARLRRDLDEAADPTPRDPWQARG